ncbi:MAG: transporter permease [Devosia sp.]|nr:transporter permease [Devosia sp.]
MTNVLRKPWIWSFVAAFGVWLTTILFTGGESTVGVTQAALTFAAFSVIVGLGQMFVITLGPGNVDLSIPATMTLAGTVALKTMETNDSLIVAGILVALAIGVCIGLVNFALIKLLRIPPIIATLSSSFLIQSTAIWYNRGLRIKPPATLTQFAIGSTAGIPNVAIVALLISMGMWILLEKGIFGRRVAAIGQNMWAARLAGVPVDGTRLATYVLCATLASLAGLVLSCFSGGAALNMGAEYLLTSIAVVVIGGTAVAGGFANVPGIWGGALFLFLVVSMLNTYGASAGLRMLLTGVIIIAVIIAASRKPAR